MNKYIIEILKNHSSLILPGIGALMVVNKKTGDIKFNPHLTFNDGALANFIANKEGIDKADAQNKVAKFTTSIKNDLNKGETYDIFEFGVLSKNENGEITFEMTNSKRNKLDETLKKASKTTKKITKDTAKKTSEILKKGAGAVSGVAGKTGDVLKSGIKETGKATKSVTDGTKVVAGKTKDTAKEVTKMAGGILKKGAGIVSGVADKTGDVLKSGVKETGKTAKSITDGTKAGIDKGIDKIKSVKNTYIPPIEDTKLPEVPKISSAVSSASKTVKNTTETIKENIVEKTQIIEKKRRKKWPFFILLLLVGLAIAAYYFKDKIMAVLGINNQAKIENVNHYPDADNDGIPDFADIDITKGQDLDHDGIDDLADLDFTNGEDKDGDGIDDAFATMSMNNAQVADFDPLKLSDNDEDGIPDFADIDVTTGEDINDNGIDDLFDSAIILGEDENKDCINDSLANIALLNHINAQFSDVDSNKIPDYADINLTKGTDVNKNGIDDAFESIDLDLNGDGLNDSIQMIMASTLLMNGSNVENETTEQKIDKEQNITKEQEVAEEETIIEEDISQPETVVEETTIVEEVKPMPIKDSNFSATGNYHAIGAAFAEKSNAVNYVSSMSSNGFNATIVGRFDGLYLVSLKQYGNLGDAKSDLSNMRSTSNHAWIFKH